MDKRDNNLLTGSVSKQLITFALPFLVSNILQTVYSAVDMLIVGKIMGPAGLSGVSVGGQITGLFTSSASGLAMGGQILIAQYKGRGDRQAQNETTGTMLTFMAIFALVLIIPCVFLAEPLLGLLNTPDESFADAKAYFLVCTFGTIFIFGYNSICSVFRGLGDSKHPMMFVAISTVLNIILDLLCVGPLHMGTAGAALATVIAQGVSFILALLFLKKNKERFAFDFDRRSFRIVNARLKPMLKVGIPFALQFSVLTLSMLFMISMINVYGVSAGAAYGVGGKVDNFGTMPVFAMGAAASTMIAQNIGAGNYKRAKSVVYWCMGICLCVEVIIFSVLQIFAAPVISIFNDDPQVIAIGVMYLRIMSFAYFAHCFMNSYLAMAKGAGNGTLSLVCFMVDSIIVRIPLCRILGNSLGMGIKGIFIGNVAAPFVAAAISAVYFYRGSWKKKSLINDQTVKGS